jgi:Immunity protein 53
MKEKDGLLILQNWVLNNCNGDWEHEYGVKIETTDNPGWSLKIDLTETPLENLFFSKTKNQIPNCNSWFDIKVEKNVFIGYGSDLSELIEVFYKEFLLPNLQVSNFFFPIYAKIPNSNPEVWRELIGRMVDINVFEITDIIDIDVKGLKVGKVEDFESVNFSKISTSIGWNIGDKVKCQLTQMYDYPTLVIVEK